MFSVWEASIALVSFLIGGGCFRGAARKAGKLSEAVPSSDRFVRICRKAVRSSSEFGQVQQDVQENCPKQS
jgi:hypothetical protein